MTSARLALIFLCCCHHVVAAAQTVNRRYDAWGQLRAECAFGVEQRPDSTYIIFLGSAFADSLLYSSVVSTIRVQADGTPLDTQKVYHPQHNTYVGHANVAFPTPNGYALGGSSTAQDGTQRPVLFLFDSLGAVTGFTEYGVTGESWIGRQGKATADGGYVISGETSSTGTSLDAFLLKIDSAGNQEWVFTYGGATTREYGWAVDLAPGGGYYLSGARDVAPFTLDHWIARIDSAGALMWEETFGTPNNDQYTAHVTTLADGNMVYASSWAQDQDGNLYRLGLSKVDSTGDMQWMHLYDGITYGASLFTVKEIAPGGDLISAGHSYVPGYLHGTLLRTDNMGDSLWMRYYHYEDSLITEGTGRFLDVLPTLDGGFIAVGAAYNSNNPNDPLVYSQDTWLVKVDSMGCLVPGCDGIGMIASQNTNYKEVLSIAPNPAHSTAQVSWALHGAQRNGDARLSIVSSSGAVVHAQDVDLSSGGVQLDVCMYQAGIYYLHLVRGNDWFTGCTLVVE